MKFKCKDCENKFEKLKIQIHYNEHSSRIYKNKGQQIKCPQCFSLNIEDITQFRGFCANLGKFAGSTPEQKKEILKKRAKQHVQSRSEVERVNHINKNFNGTTKSIM